MERIVIEKNKIIIFKGLMELLFVSSDQTLSIGAKEKHNNRTAPVKEINQ